jgi:hypothetical protein
VPTELSPSTRLVRRDDPDVNVDYEYVAYRHEVDGKPFCNDRIYFGPQVVTRSIVPSVDPEPNAPYAAAALARRYPRGTPVRRTRL